MLLRNRRKIALLVVASLLLFVYQQWSESVFDKVGPARVEPLVESGLNRITLTARAAERLDIKTAPVREEKAVTMRNSTGDRGTPRKVVPYSAVIYDVNGKAWAYTNPEPLVFIRHPITIDYIDGDVVFLSHGPTSGTSVVTVGVAELYGAEMGIGK